MLVDKKDGMLEFTFTWKIENFNHCMQRKGQCLLSPAFTLDETRWQLRLYPKGYEEDNYIACFLKKMQDDRETETTIVDFELSIIDADISPQQIKLDLNKSFDQKSWGCHKFLSRKVLWKEKRIFLLQDTLTVRCRVWRGTTGLSKSRQCFAQTRIGVERKSFIWTIPKFSTLEANEEGIFRDESITAIHPILRFKLKLREGSCCDGKIEIEISQIEAKTQHFSSCRICVIDSEGKTVDSAEDEYLFLPELPLLTWHFPQFITKTKIMDRKKDILPDDVLSLRCMYTISAGVITSEIDDHGSFLLQPEGGMFKKTIDISKNGKSSAGSLIQELKNAHREEFLCDFFLRAEGHTFPVHRIILGARSLVFKSMFTTDMREKATDMVDIPDIDADTIRRMLRFVYEDIVDDLKWDEVSKLYFAADKYSILSLKQKCSSLLESRITPTNACEILTLADTHQDEDLKKFVRHFIFDRDSEIFISEEWKKFMEINLKLAAETMHLKCIRK